MLSAAALAAVVVAASAVAQEPEKAPEVPERSDILPRLSFSPPFESFDADGKRKAAEFMHGGVAEVRKNYIRLTSDRAVRTGRGRERAAPRGGGTVAQGALANLADQAIRLRSRAFP